ncbi:MAG: electron transfer flavoprotein alpha subunit [Cellvibrionaceae bacterium]|jgi:electron transfer flavoprotein alpha subunit
MSLLIIADHTNSALVPATYNTVTAATQLDNDIHMLIAGHECRAAADEAAKISGVSKVLVADNQAYNHLLAENVSALVVELSSAYESIIAPATTSGKNILPRIAALLDCEQISDVIQIISPTIFKRPFYAGNAIATVETNASQKLLTIRGTAFNPAEKTGGCIIEPLEQVHNLGLSTFISEELAKADRPELSSARVVIAGGRGMQNAENFTLLDAIADKLDAAIGASRAAVDAGFVPNDMQVGQTGKIVAPDLYIAVGISGAIQHLAGMKDSKIIVAINKDEDAPIFQVADYGLVADLFDILPELEKML